MKLILTVTVCKKTDNFVAAYNKYVETRNKYNDLSFDERNALELDSLKFMYDFSIGSIILSSSDKSKMVYNWLLHHVQDDIDVGSKVIFFEFDIDKMVILSNLIENKIEPFNSNAKEVCEEYSKIIDGLKTIILNKSRNDYCFLYSGYLKME